MKKHLALFLICCLVLPSGTFAQGERSSGFLFKRAERLMDAGMYLEALNIYEELSDLTQNPELRAEFLRKAGDIYSHYLGQPDEALKQYDLLLQNHPASYWSEGALFNSAMLLYEKGNTGEAHRRFSSYIERYPRGLRIETAQFMEKRTREGKPAPAKPPEEVYIPPAITAKIRVAIASGRSRLEIPGPVIVADMSTGQEVYRAGASEKAVFSSSNSRIDLNGHTLGSTLVVLSADDGLLRVNGSKYRGAMVIKTSGSGMLCVNDVLLEQYLYSVVSAEVSSKWPEAALRAQAIAARSYALYQIQKRVGEDYDVFPDERSQVYRGLESESPESRAAVDATRGSILSYGGATVLALYHANSGGYTEPAANVWGAALPYLTGMPDPYSLNTPGSDWEEVISLQEINRLFKGSGVDIEGVRDIMPGKQSQSGMMSTLKVVHSGGVTEIRSSFFRQLLDDPHRIKSTWFTIQRRGDAIVFRGKGFGHRVGMSQWGACNMAKQGFSPEQILKHYYRGAEIARMAG